MSLLSNKRYVATLQRKAEFKDVKKPNSEARAEGSTIGELTLIDTLDNTELFSCYTCENEGESTDIPNTDKRIVAREYGVVWCFTGSSQGLHKNGAFRGKGLNEIEATSRIFAKHKHLVDSKLHERWNWGFWNLGLTLWTPELKSFVNRSVFIHNGNYPQDTLACLLLGYGNSNKGYINNSAQCIEDFNGLVLKIGAENLKIVIKEIDNE